MDIKFSHDLLHSKSPHKNDYSALNMPEWATHPKVNHRGRRYTTPNPLLNGLRFTAQRTLEMPPYGDIILDKETVWTQPLFPFVSEGTSAGVLSSGGRMPNVRHTEGRSGDPVPCFSYEALAETHDFGRSPFESKRKYPRPEWDYKDLRPVFNRR
jgi:hypothetical protein